MPVERLAAAPDCRRRSSLQSGGFAADSGFMASLAGRNRTVVAALLIALVAAFSLTYPASAKAAVVGPEVGVQWHAVWSSYSDVQRVQVLDSVKASGMQWVRIDVGWDMIETNYRGERNAYWTSRLDDFIGMAVARGLKPMVMLYQTPAWARPSGTASNTPPSDPATFASFAGWAAARWAGRVAAWEIWNEPNLDGFWRGTDPAAYSRLVRLAYPAIKSADPRALVVAGAVSYNDDAFLAKMYAAGARGFFDVLSTHPYMGQADAAPEAGDDGTIWTMRHVCKFAGVHQAAFAMVESQRIQFRYQPKKFAYKP